MIGAATRCWVGYLSENETKGKEWKWYRRRAPTTEPTGLKTLIGSGGEIATSRRVVDSPPPPPSSALPRPIPLALSASWKGNVLACAETLGERLRDLRQGLRQLEAEKRSAQQVTPPSPSCADVFHIDNNACSRPKARAVVVCVDAADYSRQITLAQRAALDLRERRLRELERHVGVVAGYEQRLDVVEQRLGALLIGKGLLTSEKQQSVVWDPYPLTLLAHHRLDKS
eukprot:PhM_4_TR19063/c0_g1_i2/m.103217